MRDLLRLLWAEQVAQPFYGALTYPAHAGERLFGAVFGSEQAGEHFVRSATPTDQAPPLRA